MATVGKFMHIELFFVFLLFSTSTATAQTDTTFFPWRHNGQPCFINTLGELRTDTSASLSDYPTPPKTPDELLAYEYLGLYGFKDEKGEVVIQAGYERVGQFREGFAWVKMDYKRYYYINRQGDPLLNFTFDRCYNFQNGLARVFDKNENIGNQGFGYIDRKGKVVIPLQYLKAFDFVNDHALVQDSDSNWWLIDQNGNKIQGPCQGLK